MIDGPNKQAFIKARSGDHIRHNGLQRIIAILHQPHYEVIALPRQRAQTYYYECPHVQEMDSPHGRMFSVMAGFAQTLKCNLPPLNINHDTA